MISPKEVLRNDIQSRLFLRGDAWVPWNNREDTSEQIGLSSLRRQLATYVSVLSLLGERWREEQPPSRRALSKWLAEVLLFSGGVLQDDALKWKCECCPTTAFWSPVWGTGSLFVGISLIRNFYLSSVEDTCKLSVRNTTMLKTWFLNILDLSQRYFLYLEGKKNNKNDWRLQALNR